MGKQKLRNILSVMLSLALVFSLSIPALAAEGETHLTIIGTSDTHGNIWGYSYEDMKESSGDGLARISTYVSQVRAENPNTILVDAGDTIQGTIMTDDLYSKDTENHPVPAALNYMGYDAWTLGNHEFNFGVDTLKAILAQADMPVLAANIKNTDGSYLTGAGYTIVEKGGVKVAIIGVDTPNIPRWDGTKQGVAELTFEPMADAVAECIQAIGDSADVIMVCAHAGLAAEYSTDGSDAAQTILDKCPEVDVLQLGHTHTTYVSNDGPIPVGETNNNAAVVLRYDLTLNADKEITSAAVQLIPMTGIEPDQGLREVPAIQTAQEKTVSFIQDNVLGHAAADFQPANEISGIPAGRIMDTAVIDLIGTVQLENSGADVTAVALFKDTSDLKQGDLNYGNMFDIYKYPNVLYTVKVTGAEMKAYMEWAAECWNQWQPGDINISFNPDKAGYLHDHFCGLNYEVNLSKPAGERIENVTFQGQPLSDEMTLTLCVNDYRYTGLKNEGIISGEKEWESSASVRDMLVAYLAEHDPLEPKVDNNWKITGVDLQTDSPERAAYIEKVNSGALATPYNKSINLNQPNNVIVNGVLYSAATAVDAAGNTYYRLRDLATAFNGTTAQFNPYWLKSAYIALNTPYTERALEMPEQMPVQGTPFSLAISADGNSHLIDAILVQNVLGGNYYVTVEGINTLLGINAVETDGVLTLTADSAGPGSGNAG
ncbi:bifunctional metallophosphatase/5'-nucleotidase [uncultured Flavonifractor sp.]|uniref:bifunctional metallophosphatase/5'-nucleotidase n=1 Tax=uncultured Flavonifractor sp. TaxID=1193534 RepID=UPI00260C6DF3|nr:5'-nucleotidase C-terminal domain-containing protein [uncultured Flavonifractor sp.]